MSAVTTPEKPLSKKKILNKAKYAVISAERIQKRTQEQLNEWAKKSNAADLAVAVAQRELDALLAE